MKNLTFLHHAENAVIAEMPASDPREIPLTENGEKASKASALNSSGPPPSLISL